MLYPSKPASHHLLQYTTFRHAAFPPPHEEAIVWFIEMQSYTKTTGSQQSIFNQAWDLCLPVGRKGSVPTGHLEQWVSLRTGIYLPYLMQRHYRDAEKGTEHWKTKNQFSIVLFFLKQLNAAGLLRERED